MIINIDNAASQKYVMQKLRVYEWLDQKWLGIHLLYFPKMT